MAVANTKSSSITNAEATPRVPNNPFVDNGIPANSVATVEVAAADSDGSVYRFCRLPSGARVKSIKIYCDAITGGTSFDCGIYKNAADGGAVVDADLFASAVDLSSAITSGTELVFEANDIANIEKRIWDILALSADPFLEYELCLTANTVGSAAGTISMSVEYVL